MLRFVAFLFCDQLVRRPRRRQGEGVSVTCASVLNVFGLVANLSGVILLFRYGMPYRARTGGETVYIASGSANEDEIAAERRYDRLGWLGLILIVLGTAAQIAAIFNENFSNDDRGRDGPVRPYRVRARYLRNEGRPRLSRS
jgi:hypothetical protein